MTLETAVLFGGLVMGGGGVVAWFRARYEAEKLAAEAEKLAAEKEQIQSSIITEIERIKQEIEVEFWERVQNEIGRLTNKVTTLEGVVEAQAKRIRVLESENDELRKGL